MKALACLGPACLAVFSPVLSRAADLGLPAAYLCGGHAVAIVAGPDEARLRLGGRWLTFRPAVAASGAKYDAEGATDGWVWNKGTDFTISLPETGEVTCAAAAPAPETFAAGGVEPGWRLTLQDGQARLTPQEGAALAAAHTVPEPVPGGRRIAFGPATAEIADAICRDAATGMPYPNAVRVIHAERTYEGCGGDPGDLLSGIAWKVTVLDGQPMPEGVDADLRFDGGRAAGTTGCNRFSGAYGLTGEGLTIGPLAMTRMACPEPQSAVERAMASALASATRFDMGEDGGLILLSGDAPVLAARP